MNARGERIIVVLRLHEAEITSLYTGSLSLRGRSVASDFLGHIIIRIDSSSDK
jgi:hypothetical protein